MSLSMTIRVCFGVFLLHFGFSKVDDVGQLIPTVSPGHGLT